MITQARQVIFDHMEKYRDLIKPFDRGWDCLEIGIDGDEPPSGNYKYFGQGNNWKTLDCLESTHPDILADITNNNLPDNNWNLVICSQVLEHIYNVQKAVSEVIRITKPGGFMILDNPWGCAYHGNDRYGDYWRMSLACMDRMIGNKASVVDGSQLDNMVILLAQKEAK